MGRGSGLVLDHAHLLTGVGAWGIAWGTLGHTGGEEVVLAGTSVTLRTLGWIPKADQTPRNFGTSGAAVLVVVGAVEVVAASIAGSVIELSRVVATLCLTVF